MGGILKTLITISTVFAIILLYDYYKHLAKIEYTKWGFPDANSAWFHTSLFYKFFFEAAIISIHPLPFLTFESDYIGIIMFCRLYLMIRYVRDHSDIYRFRHQILLDNKAIRKLRPVFITYFLIYL